MNTALNSANETAGSPCGRDIVAASFKRFLLYLFVLGLIVRTGFMIEHVRSPSFGVLTLDQKYYDSAARMLLAGENLHQLHGFRPLLYPMFLAAIYKIGGAHGIDLAVAVQHLLGVLTAMLVALIAARLFRHRVAGLAAGALYLLAPVPLYFEGELLIESSYVFLICLGFLLLCYTVEASPSKEPLLWLRAHLDTDTETVGTPRRGVRTAGPAVPTKIRMVAVSRCALWLLCGGLTVLTAQERPNILVFMAVYPLLAAWRWWRSRHRAAWLPLLALIGGFAMAVTWGFVNKMQLDHFQIMPSSGGVNLYLGNKRTADGMEPEQERRVTYGERYEDSGEIWAREEYEAAMRAQGRQPDTDPMDISKYWTHRTIAEIKAAPIAWLHLMAKKSWLMFWNVEVPNNKAFAFLQTEFAWLRFLPVRWVVLLMLAPMGIWAAAKCGNRDELFILLVYVVIYSAANVAFFICDRYRYPVWPAMAIFAGGGLVALMETIRRRNWPRASWFVASMAVMALISLPNWFGARLPSFARDYLFRSIAWYEKGHFPEALRDVDQSLALDPGEITALHHRGNVLLALNRYDDARQDYESTLKIDTADAGIWNNYGAALDGLGDTNEALQAYTRATQCTPPSQSAFLGMAFDQIKSGHLTEATATLDQLEKLQHHPNAIVLALRSVIARKNGDATEAETLENQARALDSNTTTWAIDRVGK